jgi:acetyl-CoA carboxylase biotin carboxyl carrier protein
MTIEEVRELIQLVTDTGVAELEVQRGENRVRIRRSFGSEAAPLYQAPAVSPVAAPSPSAAVPKAEAAEPEAQLVFAKSPIVGTFYEAVSPDSPPFVKIGEQVTPGTVLCIIESMKLMNEIEAEVAGVIETRLVQNGQPVEYGEALFGIRPV